MGYVAASPTAGAALVMETLGKIIVDFAHQHPTITGWVIAVIVFAVLVTNALRFTYPDFKDMPGWARFITGLLDPIAGNFWNLARKVDPDLAGQAKQKGSPNEPG